MSTDERKSVTEWIEDLLARGDTEAENRLWERYFERVRRYAQATLRRGRPGAFHDAEDVALSAFHNFFAAAQSGRLTELKDRNDLWKLLVTITVRKAYDLADRSNRLKRGGGIEPLGAPAIANLADKAPSPDAAAQMMEDFFRRLESLGDETLRQIALWRLDNHTNDEIAERLGCARRTVAYKLALIRKRWSESVPRDDVVAQDDRPAPPADLTRLMLTDEFLRLLESLDDETLRQIALWKLDDLSDDAIAERLGCARRTVAYKLDLIRKRWDRETGG
jgi:DNA-directed RNA polymerase specialized sigma24 family protein